MSGVHPIASRGFARSAEAYERGRPGYPPAAMEDLAQRLRLGPGRTVVDLAAGTGKLTRELVRTGADVIAVEPLAEMRAALPPDATALEGTAEAIPLAGESADAVTVAQAFHWFDAEPALAEIHRVLRPGGALALVWNERQEDDPVNRAIDALVNPLRRDSDVPHYRDGSWRAALERSRLFGPGQETRHHNEQVLDAAGLADRVGSVSFVAALETAPREALLERVRAVAADGPVVLPNTTLVQVYPRLGVL
jgi:SAM-dependent methyltransferase